MRLLNEAISLKSTIDKECVRRKRECKDQSRGWMDVRKVRTDVGRISTRSLDAAVPIPVGEDGGQLTQVDFAVGLRDTGN